ncbi:hypothetical protein PQR71_12140 [Paraburkholderia fungorum]|uniref:hypothetical protein n=1 Tax=Paraburkholderia fungorum TaxID=134537 RepID=UPI0038B95BE5
MAYFFAYGTELDREKLLTRTVPPESAMLVPEAATSGDAGCSAVDVQGTKVDAPVTAKETALDIATWFPVATGHIEGAMLVFRQRQDDFGGPITDLLNEPDGVTWGVLFVASEESIKALCKGLDEAYSCVTRDIRIVGTHPKSAIPSFDVAASIGETVKATCLVAKKSGAPITPTNEPLTRRLLACYLEYDAPSSVLSRLMPRTGSLVADVQRGKVDLSDRLISEIYYRASPRYVVYRSVERVIVQYADDGIDDKEGRALADSQRSNMAVLNPLRSQITGLIDAWERNKHPRVADRAQRYNARVAAAMNQCLEGDPTSPLVALGEIKDEIIAERASRGRLLYLLGALIVAFVFCLVFWLLKAYAFGPLHPTAGLWLAARAGTVGAFFSIAMNIQQRKVLTDLLSRDNLADSALRITVGAIGAGVLICLLQSGLIPLGNFGSVTLAGSGMSWQVILAMGFAAGFSERLVPAIVEKLSAQKEPASLKTGGATA